MSNTIKCHTLQEAENVINRQARDLQNLTEQLKQVEARARSAAQLESTNRINIEKAKIQAQFERERNAMQQRLNNEVDKERKARIQMDLKHIELLQKQKNDFYNHLNNEIQGVQSWTIHRIDGLRNQVNATLTNQQGQINETRNSIQAILEREATEQRNAKRILVEAREMVESIKNETLHQKYAPGRLDRMERAIGMVEANGDGRQAIQQIIQLLELREEITEKKMIFEAIHNQVLAAASALLKEMSENREVRIRKDDEPLEVDFWTEGRYSILENEAAALERELNENKDKIELDKNRLIDIAKRIAEIKTEQSKLVIETLKKGEASQRRVDVCNDLVVILQEQGFWYVGDSEEAFNYIGGKEDNDVREGVTARLVDANGTDVTVFTNTNEEYKTLWGLHRNDDKNFTEEAFRIWDNQIRTLLSENSGVTSSLPAAPAGTNGGNRKIQELTDSGSLRRKGAADTLKRNLQL